MPPANLFHDRIDHGADGRIHRRQRLWIVQGPELLDDVDRRSDVLVADDLREHSPRLTTENPGPHPLPGKKPYALDLESIHTEHSPGTPIGRTPVDTEVEKVIRACPQKIAGSQR
jgi:hypothetical protein